MARIARMAWKRAQIGIFPEKIQNLAAFFWVKCEIYFYIDPGNFTENCKDLAFWGKFYSHQFCKTHWLSPWWWLGNGAPGLIHCTTPAATSWTQNAHTGISNAFCHIFALEYVIQEHRCNTSLLNGVLV